MPSATAKLSGAVEDYFAGIRQIRSTGGATDEKSLYGPLSNLLDTVGATLRPRVFCVQELADHDVGHPDFGLYTTQQGKKGQTKSGQKPERGVIEAKGVDVDARQVAQSHQVRQYLKGYQQVLVTNYRDFILVVGDSEGNAVQLESFTLASSAAEFDTELKKPRAFANKVGAGLGEYLTRVLSHSASLVEPRDLAWLLASYARDGLARVEKAGDAQSLASLREALEETLGVHFEGEQGTAFFRSSLVQTLFYGIFSAWVLWARRTPSPTEKFRWHESPWILQTPVMQALFQQLAGPTQLKPLGLVEVLDWAAAALNRVERDAFLAKFGEGDAVPYFYEPFLQAFDPDLRKQLGVWYTPPEVVRYMVARVDQALKDDLGIADGLADDNVYVLYPCCGTGAYLAEVLRRISANLQGKGLDGLVGTKVKQAAMQRVFGFEIMPAPLVVAHLQVGLTMQQLHAPFSDNGSERPGIYLTNALTGWEAPAQTELAFDELKRERERAERVKQDTPVLVILGNPPYNGFAGMAVDEEAQLTAAYKTTKRVQKPQGQGLNDLYVRFFRMAERRIAEKTGRGVVCFISNYSWLDGLSFTGMREHYMEAFDVIRIDCLNGDKYKTGKTTPDGTPDPSIFSTHDDPVGIQVGTAIATLVRKAEHRPAKTVDFRHLWGQSKHAELAAAAENEPGSMYDQIVPLLSLGLPLADLKISPNWHDWPTLPDLFPTSFPGVKSGRDSFVTDTDLEPLKNRIGEYFDLTVSHDEIAHRYPSAMRNPKEYDSRAVRDKLRAAGGPSSTGFLQYSYRPFDTRWIYWEPREKLVDRPRKEYKPHVFDGNCALVLQRTARPSLSPPLFIRQLGDLNQMNSGVYCVPVWLREEGLGISDEQRSGRRPNVSAAGQNYLDRLGVDAEDLFFHVLAVLHNRKYHDQNSDALRMAWPRIPLPGWPDGNGDAAAAELAASAAQGRELAALLDSDTPVAGVTAGTPRPELVNIAVPTATDGSAIDGDVAGLSAGWGFFGQNDAVMLGQGRVERRGYTVDERAALAGAITTLGDTTLDVYLNERACWRNVPAAVWNYQLGGYQVLKKWLSYREYKVLGRNLKPEEVQHFTNTARRIAAILMLTHAS